MSRRDLSLAAIFRIPAALAALSLTGLVGALLHDGAWDPLGAALLGACLAGTAWPLLRPADGRGRRAPRTARERVAAE